MAAGGVVGGGAGGATPGQQEGGWARSVETAVGSLVQEGGGWGSLAHRPLAGGGLSPLL